MKKVINLFLILSVFAFSAMLSSCASIPKKVKPGDTLVIGRCVYIISGYEKFEDVDFNGTFTRQLELKIVNQKDKKEKTVVTNDDGCFFITGLNAHDPYAITSVKISVYGSSGASVSTELPVRQPKMFIPYDNQVVNIGCTYFYVDYLSNTYTTETKNHYYVTEFFNDLPDDSEWFDKPMSYQGR